MELRTALSNIHRDPFWLQKVLIGGALTLSVVGSPWPAGLVVESIENAQRGYPTPLPLWNNWANRYLIGLFALLIDFFFFILPMLVIGALLFCVAIALTITTPAPQLSALTSIGGIALGMYLLVCFALGVAPIGRLLYAREGRPEEGMSAQAFREALSADQRTIYARARVLSLPAYAPALLLFLALWFVSGAVFPGAGAVTLVLLWLLLSALFYAHLVIVQLYVMAARLIG
jgi:hypothetical protein